MPLADGTGWLNDLFCLKRGGIQLWDFDRRLRNCEHYDYATDQCSIYNYLLREWLISKRFGSNCQKFVHDYALVVDYISTFVINTSI